MVRKRVLRSLQLPIFREPRGRKEVWFPNWHITLLRNPILPPNMAQFLVPLKISKLDLKDYLFHAYGIPALSIRSSIKQHAPASKTAGGQFYRPQSTKHMIVEMGTSDRGGPFAWPEEPESMEPWDKEIFDALKKKRDGFSDEALRYGNSKKRREPNVLAKQVTTLLDGTQTWTPTWTERKDYNAQQLATGTPWKPPKETKPRRRSATA